MLVVSFTHPASCIDMYVITNSQGHQELNLVALVHTDRLVLHASGLKRKHLPSTAAGC